MEALENLINLNLDKHSEHKDFFLYTGVLKDTASSPDLKIDAAKSLIEAVAKTLLKRLDSSLSKQQLEGLKIKSACKRLLTEIAKRSNDFGDDFADRMLSVIIELSTKRSELGAMSHGHTAPKTSPSKEFIDMVLAHVTSICIYLLARFYEIDFSHQEPDPYDGKENDSFNNYLDGQRQPIGKIPYSYALYQLDYESWIDERDRYIYDA